MFQECTGNLSEKQMSGSCVRKILRKAGVLAWLALEGEGFALLLPHCRPRAMCKRKSVAHEAADQERSRRPNSVVATRSAGNTQGLMLGLAETEPLGPVSGQRNKKTNTLCAGDQQTYGPMRNKKKCPSGEGAMDLQAPQKRTQTVWLYG